MLRKLALVCAVVAVLFVPTTPTFAGHGHGGHGHGGHGHWHGGHGHWRGGHAHWRGGHWRGQGWGGWWVQASASLSPPAIMDAAAGTRTMAIIPAVTAGVISHPRLVGLK
jgi:hypothetical protein